MKKTLPSEQYLSEIVQPICPSDDLFYKKPFSLYSGQMQIGIKNYANLMERETVQYFKQQFKEA